MQMRKKFLPYLHDPLSHDGFKVLSLNEKEEHIISGLLLAKDNWYPIINAIPRILVSDLKKNLLVNHKEFFDEYKTEFPSFIVAEWQKAIEDDIKMGSFNEHQKRTSESFAYEWDKIYRENKFEKNNFFHFLSPFIKENDLYNKIVLDAGCGSGRFTKQAALAGSYITFGTDLGESVEVAYRLTKNLKNVCIIQADIYSLPFRDIFDIILSIGVLHHLPKPQEGFSKLPLVLNKDGQILIWVYNRRNNTRALYFYEPLRTLVRNIPKKILYKLCYIPALAVHVINYLSRLLKLLGFGFFAKKIPFYYYSHFPFNMKLNDAFDVLATPKSNYYFVEEIRQWFSEAELGDIQAYEHKEAGITCTGITKTGNSLS